MRNIQLAFVILLTTLLFFSTTVSADSNEIPFSVSPVGEDKGYFDFQVTEGFQQTIYLEAHNLTGHPITLLITPINASTSSYGQIVYNVNAKKNQFVNLKVPLSQYISVKEKATIPANSSEKIPLEIQLESIENGTVLGGIHVIAEDETFATEEIQQKGATFQIKNQVAYVIGVKLQTPELAIPEFSFKNVRIDIQYNNPKLFIEMTNSAPAVIKDLSGTYEVFDKKGKLILADSFTKLKMAPNTRFEYGIDWVDGKIKPGKYTVKLSGIVDGKKITAEKELIIEDKEKFNDYNKEADKEKKEKEGTNSFTWWGYFLTALIAGFIFFLIGRRSKSRD